MRNKINIPCLRQKYSCKARGHITNNNGKKGKPNQKKKQTNTDPTIFNDITATLWSVGVVVDETGVCGDNHRYAESYRLLQVVSNIPL